MTHFLGAFIVLLYIIGLHACVKEDVCTAEHPHLTNVIFHYDEGNMTQFATKPSDMRIACNKIILSDITNINYNLNTSNGYFLDNLPPSITTESNHDLTVFPVVSGEYKFFTVNMGLKGFDFTELEAYIASKRTASLGTRWIYYHATESLLPPIEHMNHKWTDYNPYNHTDGTMSGYVISSPDPLMVDSSNVLSLELGETLDVNFKPMSLTHNIDIYFDIMKDVASVPFIIDSVYCVVSGIPAGVNIGTGALDISNTNKMMFKTDYVSPSATPDVGTPKIQDSKTNTAIRVYKNVNVLGIVENQIMQDDDFAGPGVMQCIIYCKVYDPAGTLTDSNGDKYRMKTLNGIVNIHNSLLNAQLQTYYPETNITTKSRPHSDLYIHLNVTLDADMLQGDDDGGIKKWHEVPQEEWHDDVNHSGDFDIY